MLSAHINSIQFATAGDGFNVWRELYTQQPSSVAIRVPLGRVLDALPLIRAMLPLELQPSGALRPQSLPPSPNRQDLQWKSKGLNQGDAAPQPQHTHQQPHSMSLYGEDCRASGPDGLHESSSPGDASKEDRGLVLWLTGRSIIPRLQPQQQQPRDRELELEMCLQPKELQQLHGLPVTSHQPIPPHTLAVAQLPSAPCQSDQLQPPTLSSSLNQRDFYIGGRKGDRMLPLQAPASQLFWQPSNPSQPSRSIDASESSAFSFVKSSATRHSSSTTWPRALSSMRSMPPPPFRINAISSG